MPPSDRTPPEPGLKKLLAAILAEDGPDDEEEPELDALLDAEDDGPGPVPDSVLRFLRTLVQAEALELEEGADFEALGRAVAPHIEGRGRADRRAAALLDTLLDHDAVAEVYIEDEQLIAILEKW